MRVLTDNEKQVLHFALLGYANIEIAEEIGYSERTIVRIFKDLKESFHASKDRQLIGILKDKQLI